MPTPKPPAPKALDSVACLYRQSLSQHGASSKAVGWKDEASQQLRFDKLAEVMAPLPKGMAVTVNDLGCGYGAMFHYLGSRPGVELAAYWGYDISEEMLEAARRSVPDTRAHFIQSSRFTQQADYSFVSGTFNVKMDASDEEWGDYVKQTLLDMAAHSARGMAFNLLSTYVDWKAENLFYADPFEFFDFCKRNISRFVSLLHDYPLYEWTILVRQQEADS